MRHRTLRLALPLAALLAGAGCGGGNTVQVSGKLLRGGVRYVPPTGHVVNATLVGLGTGDAAGKAAPGGELYVAEVDQATGTFTVPGHDRRGIPPGKYRVAVTQKMTRETFNATNSRPKKGIVPNREADSLFGKYGPDTSPFVREIKSSGELVIDLDRPEG